MLYEQNVNMSRRGAPSYRASRVPVASPEIQKIWYQSHAFHPIGLDHFATPRDSTNHGRHQNQNLEAHQEL